MPETINTLRLVRPCAPCLGLGCILCQHTGQRIQLGRLKIGEMREAVEQPAVLHFHDDPPSRSSIERQNDAGG